ncbi:hypothetical protein PROFUN_15281 [Planoprotostelium fungivorum]|uniref:Uncharacterized protein n=1 Tax=Planoprotostelium fungivorum TaxID=1890364 RepID=A0A2P6MXE0_9EUKA|nr:hypothetical protein PROFUN_15281 [Planoprotostelium fungivorum]
MSISGGWSYYMSPILATGRVQNHSDTQTINQHELRRIEKVLSRVQVLHGTIPQTLCDLQLLSKHRLQEMFRLREAPRAIMACGIESITPLLEPTIFYRGHSYGGNYLPFTWHELPKGLRQGGTYTHGPLCNSGNAKGVPDSCTASFKLATEPFESPRETTKAVDEEDELSILRAQPLMYAPIEEEEGHDREESLRTLKEELSNKEKKSLDRLEKGRRCMTFFVDHHRAIVERLRVVQSLLEQPKGGMPSPRTR